MSIIDRLSISNPAIDDPYVTAEILKSMSRKISYVTLAKCTPEQREIDLTLCFTYLLKCAESEHEMIRTMSFRTMGFILLKLFPFYNTEIVSVFTKIAIKQDTSPKGSSFIASCYAFITKNLPPHNLDKFITLVPTFQHFLTEEPTFKEHLPDILSGLKHLGVDWHKVITQKLIMQENGNVVSIATSKAIVSLINHFPEQLFPVLLSTTSDITLISYVASNANGIDLDLASDNALTTFSNPESTFNELESAIAILAKLNINIKIEEHTVIVKYKNKLASNNISKLQGLSSFYILPLPLEYLLLKEDDGAFTIRSKLIGLANLVPTEEKAIQMFDGFLAQPYNSATTYGLQALALAVQKVIETVTCDMKLNQKQAPNFDSNPIEKIAPVVQRAVFAKPVSWFHTKDQIEIVAAVGHQHLFDFFGQDVGKVYNYIIKAVMSDNPGLSSRAKSIAIDLIDDNSFKERTEQITKEFDYFDIEKLTPVVDLLASVLLKFPNRNIEHIIHSCSAVFEVAQFLEGLPLFDAAFKLGSAFTPAFFSRPFIKPIFMEAAGLAVAAYNSISGVHWDPGIGEAMMEKQSALLSDYIGSIDVDITSGADLSISNVIKPLQHAIDLLFEFKVSSLDRGFSFELVEKFLMLFPIESAKFAAANWEYFMDGQKPGLIKMLAVRSQMMPYTALEIVVEMFAGLSVKDSYLTASVKEAINHTSILSPSCAASIMEYSKLIDTKDLVTDGIKELANSKSQNNELSKEKVTEKKCQTASLRNFLESNESNEEFTNKILKLCLVQRDLKNLQVVLEYAKEHAFHIDIPPYVFEEAIPLMLKYLPTPSGMQYARQNLETPFCIEAARMTPDSYLALILAKERPKKEDMFRLCSLAEKIALDSATMAAVLTKCLLTANTPSRLRASLTLAYVFVSSSEVDGRFLDSIHNAAASNYSQDACEHFARLFFEIARRGGRSTINIHSISPKSFNLSCARDLFNIKKGTVYENKSILLQLESWRPDVVCGALMFLVQAGQTLSREAMFKIELKAAQLVLKIPFYKNSEIDYAMAAFLRIAFRDHEVRQLFVAKYDFPSLRSSSAAFAVLAPTFPALFASADSGAKDFEKVSSACNAMLLRPPNDVLFHAYVESISARDAAFSRDAVSKDTVASDLVLAWIRHAGEYDSPKLAAHVQLLAGVLRQSVGFEQCMVMLCVQFAKAVPRFFPLFVGVSRFLSSVWGGLTDEEKERAREALESAALTMKEPAHVAAFHLLARRTKMRDALSLALAEGPETAATRDLIKSAYE